MIKVAHWVVSFTIALALVGPVWADQPGSAPVATGDGLKPGDVLNRTNWQKAQGLLPPEILKHYEKGEYANPIVEFPPTYNWPENFLEGSRANEGRYAIGERGEVVEKATGKQPLYIFGYPFPTIDPADPQAAVKILWNYNYFYWYWGSMHVQAQVNWVAPRGLERRTDQDVNFFFYDGGPEKDRSPNPHNFLMQQLLVVVRPADLNGTAALTWRYRDPAKRDSAWAFVPALRRVRAVSPANRSDGFLGSDMSQDDGNFFEGKTEDFTWTLKGEVDYFRLVDPLNLAGKSNSVWLPTGGWRTYWPDMPYLGYHDPNWQGVGWAPIGMALAKRRFYLVEGVPKDKYYLYGHLELYVDKETFQGAWNRKFSWSGELLNTFQVAAFTPHRYVRPDGRVDYLQGSNMNFQCAENIKAFQATVAGQKWDPNAAMDLRVPFDAAFFETNSLARFGK